MSPQVLSIPNMLLGFHGVVRDRDNNLLPGVTVTVSLHSELGRTISRMDGKYDLAVNGGGYLTLDYQKPGYIPTQRQIQVDWQHSAQAPDVVLIQRDDKVTVIDLTAPGMKVARSSVSADTDGSRQATLLFPEGLQAQVYNPDGSKKSINQLSFRGTEFTVGDNGFDAMPGSLPPASAYTYAIEFKVDEATTKIDGKDVLFDRPVIFYSENFLGLEVGSGMPSGYYDDNSGFWVASDDGLIVKNLKH